MRSHPPGDARPAASCGSGGVRARARQDSLLLANGEIVRLSGNRTPAVIGTAPPFATRNGSIGLAPDGSKWLSYPGGIYHIDADRTRTFAWATTFPQVERASVVWFNEFNVQFTVAPDGAAWTSFGDRLCRGSRWTIRWPAQVRRRKRARLASRKTAQHGMRLPEIRKTRSFTRISTVVQRGRTQLSRVILRSTRHPRITNQSLTLPKLGMTFGTTNALVCSKPGLRISLPASTSRFKSGPSAASLRLKSDVFDGRLRNRSLATYAPSL